MSSSLSEPTGSSPAKIIVAIVTGQPGAVAIMDQEGYPLAIRTLPDISQGGLSEATGLLGQILHNNASVDVIAKVVIAHSDRALVEASSDEPFIRGGVGYLYTLLTWLKIPTIVANPGWLSHFATIYEDRSALSIVRDDFPGFFDEAYDDEVCARAAILAYLGVTNPDWSGVGLQSCEAPLPNASDPEDASLH